jgi:hypothetical protein
LYFFPFFSHCAWYAKADGFLFKIVSSGWELLYPVLSVYDHTISSLVPFYLSSQNSGILKTPPKRCFPQRMNLQFSCNFFKRIYILHLNFTTLWKIIRKNPHIYTIFKPQGIYKISMENGVWTWAIWGCFLFFIGKGGGGWQNVFEVSSLISIEFKCHFLFQFITTCTG